MWRGSYSSSSMAEMEVGFGGFRRNESPRNCRIGELKKNELKKKELEEGKEEKERRRLSAEGRREMELGLGLEYEEGRRGMRERREREENKERKMRANLLIRLSQNNEIFSCRENNGRLLLGICSADIRSHLWGC